LRIRVRGLDEKFCIKQRMQCPISLGSFAIYWTYILLLPPEVDKYSNRRYGKGTSLFGISPRVLPKKCLNPTYGVTTTGKHAFASMID